MLKIRCSSLGLIMTEPKSKSDVLSQGAKTYIKSLAKEFVYGFNEVVTSKYMDKGLMVENDSIALYNRVMFTDFAKNEERKTNDWLTGECDIFTGTKIIDIKSSWSLATFPALSEEAHDNKYEWQLRGYMMLWDCNFAELAYCMIDTPDELIKYEQLDLHQVSHINESLRLTIFKYERDLELEAKIKEKVEAAQIYFNQVIDQIGNDHNF